MPLPFLYSVTAALDGWWRPDGMRRRRNSHWTADGADGGRRRVATGAGGAPAGHGNPPPASRALWETAQLGKRRRETPARFRGTLRPTPALGPAPGGDRCRRMADATGGAPAGHGNPRQPPGHFERWPNWANAAGEPPARFRGTLRSPPALGPAPTAVGAGW